MHASTIAAQFFGGIFLANAALHLVVGLAGKPFPTPFAKPPFRGLSRPTVNVVYGLLNLVVAYTLVIAVGGFELRRVASAAVAGAGFGLWALVATWRATKIPQG